MIDAGLDWLGRLDAIAPDVILLTHAHPDHAFGLAEGSPAPVYAPAVAINALAEYPLSDKVPVEARTPIALNDLTVEAFPVDHSTVAPAVGYRLTSGDAGVFYVPDVVYIPDRADAMQGIDLYIGDGATIERSMVRRSGDALVGHTPIRTQLSWCRDEGVGRAVFTHCGTQIVAGDERKLRHVVRRLGMVRGVEASIAFDGQVVRV